MPLSLSTTDLALHLAQAKNVSILSVEVPSSTIGTALGAPDAMRVGLTIAVTPTHLAFESANAAFTVYRRLHLRATELNETGQLHGPIVITLANADGSMDSRRIGPGSYSTSTRDPQTQTMVPVRAEETVA